MLLRGAFAALLVLTSAASAGPVPPPENVTIQCNNLASTVQWDYDQQGAPTKFIIYHKQKQYETVDRRFNVSNLWESLDSLIDYQHVSVAARRGGSVSKNVSVSFNFNDLLSTDVKCAFDFPPVTLTTKNTNAILRFQNPMQFHRRLENLMRGANPTFCYEVSYGQPDISGECSLNHKICETEVTFQKGSAPTCMKLKGELIVSSGQYLMFKAVDRLCPGTSIHEPHPENIFLESLLPGLLIGLFLALLATTAFLIVKVFNVRERLPDSLVFNNACQDAEHHHTSQEADDWSSFSSQIELQLLENQVEENQVEENQVEDNQLEENQLEENQLEENPQENANNYLLFCQHSMGGGDLVSGYSKR